SAARSSAAPSAASNSKSPTSLPSPSPSPPRSKKTGASDSAATPSRRHFATLPLCHFPHYPMRIALLHSRIRVEERLLAEALESRAIDHELIDVRELVFDIHDPSPWRRFDAVLERCISQTQALA